ncbi:MAG: hypothetical protein LBB11_01920 [Puniceicoccales bacterium]|jgi:hypothetical protein|nr:hypothetical protein [Puniceicoccales bacterium]
MMMKKKSRGLFPRLKKLCRGSIVLCALPVTVCASNKPEEAASKGFWTRSWEAIRNTFTSWTGKGKETKQDKDHEAEKSKDGDLKKSPPASLSSEDHKVEKNRDNDLKKSPPDFSSDEKRRKHKKARRSEENQKQNDKEGLEDDRENELF